MDTGSESGASSDAETVADDGEGATVPFGALRPTERRALIGCAFASMCLLLLPQELAGAGISLVITIALFVWHRRRSRRELTSSASPPRTAPADPPATPAEERSP